MKKYHYISYGARYVFYLLHNQCKSLLIQKTPKLTAMSMGANVFPSKYVI